MFICIIALMGLVIPSLLFGVIEAIKQAGKELSDIWREDRVIAYVVLASVAWCAARWKVLNKPGPHEPIFQSEWPRRLGAVALWGIFGIAMGSCVVALIVSFIKTGFRLGDEGVIWGIFICGIMTVAALMQAYRVLRGKD